MKHALLAAMAVAALAFPGLAATATNKTHAPTAAHAASAKALPRPVHQMLGAQLPFIKTGPNVGQGYILRHNRSLRPGSADATRNPNNLDNLTYGGPDQTPPKALAALPTVMTYNTNYSIFWIPNGYRTASNYITVINQFFNDISADSYGSGNIDSPAVQYMGAHDGEIYYDSTYGGFAIDTNPFPKSACNATYAAFASSKGLANGHVSAPGVNVCLSDLQIQNEVKKFADAQGWEHGPNTEFFMYTPHNVGSCFYADGHVQGGNLNNVCSYDWYCAYHSEFGGTTPDSEYIYANMPWPNQAFTLADGNQYKSDCDGGEHPNGTGSESNGTDPNGPTDLDAADEVISVTSHEHNESVTDPTGYGWWDDNPDSPYLQSENGDLCSWYWAADGSSYSGHAENNSFVTDTINGDSYFTQGEWSNVAATADGYSGCVWGYNITQPAYTPGTNTLTAPDSGAGAGSTLTLSAGDFGTDPGVYTYVWIRCSPDAVSSASRRLSSLSAKQIKAKNFTLGNGCDLVGLDFSVANTDTYKATAADVSNDIIGGVYKDNGSGAYPFAGEMAGGDGTPTVIQVTGEPELTADPSITYTGSLVPGTKLTLNLGTWSNSPTSISVQLQHCYPESPDSCSTFKTLKVVPPKTGTPSTTYLLTSGDTHWAMNAIVTGSNKAGTSNYSGNTGLTNEIIGYPTNTGAAPTWSSDSPVAGTPDAINFGGWSNTPPITGWTVTVQRCPLLTDPITEPDWNNCEFAATLTAPATATFVNYTPVASDVAQTLVAYVMAKNKNGTANPESVFTMNIVGGNPVNTVAPTWEATTATSGPGTCPPPTTGTPPPCDKVTLDLGTWSPAATQYRITVYQCTDPVDVTTCQKLGAPRSSGPTFDWKGSVGTGIDNLGHEYYLRASVQGINVNGYSNDVAWSDNAVDVDAPA